MSTFITVDEIAENYGVSTATVYRWISEGRLSGYRLGPRKLRFRREEVEAQLLTRVGPDSAA